VVTIVALTLKQVVPLHDGLAEPTEVLPGEGFAYQIEFPSPHVGMLIEKLVDPGQKVLGDVI
jgi:hypothetical protein